MSETVMHMNQPISGTTIKRTDRLIINVVGYTFITFLAVLCVLPFFLVISSSITDENSIIMDGFNLIPKVYSLEAYNILFRFPEQLIKAYAVTVAVTAIGTAFSLFLNSMTAYVLQRKDFKWRNFFSFYFFFTTLFSGGLVPFYLLVVNYLHLKDTLAILILPLLMNVFYIIVFKTFMSSSIPEAITESAKIDGASDFLIFIRLIVPLSKPVLASIGLLTALGYWNDWYNALLFISDQNLMPLQYYLYKTLGDMEGLRNAMALSGQFVNVNIPTESLKMAMTIVATGPILIVFPFVQRYFVQGMTIGAVKG